MRTIRARLTLIYALTATITVAALFLAGYKLLEKRLIHGVDVLNRAEFEHIRAGLGSLSHTVAPQIIGEYMRELGGLAPVPFYVEIRDAAGEALFASANLNGNEIPRGPGGGRYTALLNEVGDVRVGRFAMDSYEVVVASVVGQLDEAMHDYAQVSVALIVAMLVVSVAIGLGLSQLMLRPLRQIAETANRISSTRLHERIPVTNVRDEISDLAVLLNAMFQRLETSFDQIRRFSADASHELKTPLSLVRLHADELLADATLAPRQREAVQVQLEELARLDQIINELLLLSRAEARAMTLVLSAQDPTPFIHGFVQDAQVLAEHHGQVFSHRHEGSMPVAFERKWMRQVLLNLLTNALNAAPPGGRVLLESRVDETGWQLALENDGPVLSAEQREHIFDRFRRLDSACGHAGSGLGLAIARSIVDLHGGRIHAEPARHCSGLRVCIQVPAGLAEPPA